MDTLEALVNEEEKECCVEWKIKNLLNLPEEEDTEFCSPCFSFEDHTWWLKIYLNATNKSSASMRYIRLGLHRQSGPYTKLDFSFALKTVTGNKDSEKKKQEHFSETFKSCIYRLITKSELHRRQCEFLALGFLTVICNIKIINGVRKACVINRRKTDYTPSPRKKRMNKHDCLDVIDIKKENASENDDDTPSPSKKCVNECLDVIEIPNWHKNEKANEKGNKTLSNDFKEMMLNGEYSDVTIKVKGETFKLHKNVLSARNSYFNTIFKSNMEEGIAGIVSVDDCDPDVFFSFIHFLYTEKVDKLNNENVHDLYKVADKYQENELRRECLQFMMKNFSVDNFCEMFIFAIKHEENELFEKAKQFYCSKMKEIIRCAKWEAFLREYPMQVNELLKPAADFVEERLSLNEM